MTALLDAQIDGPCTYALVVGVSRYLHLEGGKAPTADGTASKLAQLSSAARSASEFAAWLKTEYRNPDAPLASLHVCLAPSDGEEIHPDVAAALGPAPGATRASVMQDWLAFKSRAQAGRDSVAFVYVAGHGVQLSKHGATLLLEDFAGEGQESKLWAGLDMKGLHASLYRTQASARQFWFVDTCREPPEIAAKFESLQGAYRGDEGVGQCDASPMFLASGPRGTAWARRQGVSLFNEALLGCLRVHAAQQPERRGGPWTVTTGSLSARLRGLVREASGTHEQTVELTGFPGTTAEILHVFEHAPRARVTVTLDPRQAEEEASATLFHSGEAVLQDTSEWPLEKELAAGLYTIQVNVQPPYSDAVDSLEVKPPASEHEVRVPQ